MATTAALKNINMMTKEQYDEVSSPATDELYAISGSGCGLPSSGRYQALTLGASGAQYTAPANGWVYVRKTNTAVGQFVVIRQGLLRTIGFGGIANNQACAFHPVLKGTFNVDYTAAGTAVQEFRFVYAEGE